MVIINSSIPKHCYQVKIWQNTHKIQVTAMQKVLYL